MDADIRAMLLEQTKLLKQIAENISVVKTIVVREAKPLTQAQQIAEVEAAGRLLNAKRSPKP